MGAWGERIAPIAMPRGAFRTRPLAREAQFAAVNDQRLQMTLAVLSDRYTEKIQGMIYATYQDDALAAIYRGIRSSGIYQKGSKSKVHRKVVEFPNPYVFDFVDTVLTPLYGPEWLQNRKALRHELVRPWHVVEHL